MTHEKFIEQLNLYIDGALPPPAAAELERELASNLERRRIYRQYCQMQQACTGLAEHFREEAAPAPHFRQGRAVEISTRASGDWIRSIALVATGALAACVVFVAARQWSPTAPALASQPAVAVPSTTTVALQGELPGFRNPWSQGTRDIVVDFTRVNPASRSLLASPEVGGLGAEETLKVDLQPYGQAPGAPLRLEEINAAAFQFQR